MDGAIRAAHPGDVAQMGERGVRNAEVEGSIPFVSTEVCNLKYLDLLIGTCA